MNRVATMPDPAHEAISILMEGQDGVWPLTTRADIASPPTWVTAPGEAFPLLGKMDYIAPWGFCERKRDKAHASTQGNLLWLDLDPPEGLRGDALARHLDDRRESLRGLLPAPSLVVWSGRGEWWYWKLTDRVTVAEFERLNRLLPRIAASADAGSWSVEHWARLPGSRNEKTGHVAAVGSISGARYEARVLAEAIELAADRVSVDVRPFDPGRSGRVRSAFIATASTVPSIKLPDDLAEYVRANPGLDQAHRDGIDRSARE